MVSIECGQKLHLRACQGDTLTQTERTELDSWYAEMDAEESKVLDSTSARPVSVDDLRDNIRQAMIDVKSTLVQIEKIEERNTELRRQNAELRSVLTAKGILAA